MSNWQAAIFSEFTGLLGVKKKTYFGEKKKKNVFFFFSKTWMQFSMLLA